MNGITREKIIIACKSLGVPIFEKNFSLLESYSADEAFLTGTFGGVVQVFSIDGHKIGNVGEGKILVKLKKFYEAMIEKH